MEQIKDLLHFYESTVSFMTHKNLNLIPLDSIAFLNQTGQIYVLGHLIGVSTEEFALLKKAVDDLSKLFASGDAAGTLDNLNTVISFLEGYTKNDKLSTILNNFNTTLSSHISDSDNPHHITKDQIGLKDVEEGATRDNAITEDELNNILI